VVDSHWDGASAATSYLYDDVTFVWDSLRSPATQVGLVTSLGELYSAEPLKPVEFGGGQTGLLSLTVRAPKGQIFYYRFLVDGTSRLDPINPQTTRHDNRAVWSRFFTSGDIESTRTRLANPTGIASAAVSPEGEPCFCPSGL
jgi:hypothetical protein